MVVSNYELLKYWIFTCYLKPVISAVFSQGILDEIVWCVQDQCGVDHVGVDIGPPAPGVVCVVAGHQWGTQDPTRPLHLTSTIYGSKVN